MQNAGFASFEAEPSEKRLSGSGARRIDARAAHTLDRTRGSPGQTLLQRCRNVRKRRSIVRCRIGDWSRSAGRVASESLPGLMPPLDFRPAAQRWDPTPAERRAPRRRARGRASPTSKPSVDVLSSALLVFAPPSRRAEHRACDSRFEVKHVACRSRTRRKAPRSRGPFRRAQGQPRGARLASSPSAALDLHLARGTGTHVAFCRARANARTDLFDPSAVTATARMLPRGAHG